MKDIQNRDAVEAPVDARRRSLLKVTSAATVSTFAGAVAAASGVASGWFTAVPHAASGSAAPPPHALVVEPSCAGCTDAVRFGDGTSENAHGLTATSSNAVTGALGQTARILLPLTPAVFWGGALSFSMRVASDAPNYVTVKLWGDESGPDLGRLQLLIDGKQVGHYHLGAVDPLDISGSEQARFPGRFFYHTLPLPLGLTSGRTSVSLTIQGMGEISNYSSTVDTYYKPLTRSTRGIYALFTHTEPMFVLPPGEVQGVAPAAGSVRTSPGPELLATINATVNAQVEAELRRSPAQLDLWYLVFLGKAWDIPSTSAYQHPNVPAQLYKGLDELYWQFINDNADNWRVSSSDQQWMGYGRVGLLLALLRAHTSQAAFDLLLSEPLRLDNTSILNPSFDLSLQYNANDPLTFADDWNISTYSGSDNGRHAYVWDASVSRSGGASVRIDGSPGATLAWRTNDKVQIGAGVYQYGVWVKTQGIGNEAGAYLDILFFGSDGHLIGGDNKVFPQQKNLGDWTFLQYVASTPAGATQFQMDLRLSGAGTAWFDDVSFVRPATAPAPLTRRNAYEQVLLTSREYWRQNAPQYTNQAIICAIGLYLTNRGLAVLGSSYAWTEAKARQYVYQAVGLSPWLGPEDASGNPRSPLGQGYYQFTPAGISKELGFAGSYGELPSWLTLIWEAVASYGGVVDADLRQQIVKIAQAREWFRYPRNDEDGHPAMVLEAETGWRDIDYPGKVAYDEVWDWEGHPLRLASVIGDADLIATAKQGLADGQVFIQIQPWLSSNSNRQRIMLNLLSFADDYARITNAADSGHRLPFTPGQPDAFFDDPENGVVAFKYKGEIVYASLYWRARYAVNSFGRFHHITDTVDRTATVRELVCFVSSERTLAVPDYVNWEFTNTGNILSEGGGLPPPGRVVHQAFAGELLPIAAQPAGAPAFAVGDESPFAGRGTLYQSVYGKYLVLINASNTMTTVQIPQAFACAVDVKTGRSSPYGTNYPLSAYSSVVLAQES